MKAMPTFDHMADHRKIKKVPSQVSDNYLVAALRRMEQDMPPADEADYGYPQDESELEDGEGFDNYEDFKLEAETRGLIWRLS